MNKINDYFMHAKLAQAAYGTFSEGEILKLLLTNKDVEMSSSQADEFLENWQVVAHSSDSPTRF